VPDFTTPFREHYELSRKLDCASQIRECADYIQHPDILVHEFLESYYLIERKSDPDRHCEFDEMVGEELVLEPFHDSLELEILDEAEAEHLVCAGGAFDPVPSEQHPALRKRGLNYIGLRDDAARIALGVTQNSPDESIYLLLLRALNCFAELSPPFQLLRLGRLVIRDRIQSDASFDLQIGMSGAAESAEDTTLRHLARDLAETFKRRILEHPQFVDTLRWIECLHLGAGGQALRTTMRRHWKV
jgi:hypothetical protein